MKLKKVISLLLLAVYLFAAAGSAVAALSCHCTAQKAHVAHVCCNHCEHDGDSPAAKADFSAPCCGDHHSTEIELYTNNSSFESEKYVKCTVISLPPSLAVECPCPEHVPFLREKIAEKRVPFIPEACVLATGLRAPPALA